MRIWLASSGPNALTQTLPGLCCGRLGSRRRTGVQRLGSHPTCPPSFRPELPIPGMSSRMGNRSQGVVCEACAEEHRWPWDTAGESRGRMSALRNQTPGLWRLELRLQGPQGMSTAELQGAPFTLCSKGRALGQPGGSLWQGPSGPVAPGETERESATWACALARTSGSPGLRVPAHLLWQGLPRARQDRSSQIRLQPNDQNSLHPRLSLNLVKARSRSIQPKAPQATEEGCLGWGLGRLCRLVPVWGSGGWSLFWEPLL